MAIDRGSSSSTSSGDPSQEFFRLMNSYLNSGSSTDFWLILERIGINPTENILNKIPVDEIELKIFEAKIATYVKKNPDTLKQRELILLAVACQFGNGAAIDTKKARSLLNLANARSETPSGEAFTLLAIINGCIPNINDLPTGDAMFKLSVSIESGPRETKLTHDPDAIDAVSNLEQAIKLGDPKACTLLAILYLYGKGVKQDIFSANNLAMEGFSRGNSQAESLINTIKNLASTEVERMKPLIIYGLRKPEIIAKTLRRTIELGCDKKEAHEELKKLSEKKRSLLRSIFFPFGRDFGIRFNVALTEKNKDKFLALAKENPKKFYALCKNENLKSIEPLLGEEMKQTLQKETKKDIREEAKLPTYS